MPDVQLGDALYRLLVSEVRDYVLYMIDPRGTILTWNSGASRIKGYQADEVIGRNFSMFFTDEDVAAGKPQREMAIAAETGRYEEEGWRVCKDGRRIWVNEVANAVRTPDGQLRGFVKITRDLSEWKQTRHALELSEQRNSTILDNLKDYAVFMVDVNNRVTTWNIGAERLLGYTESEALGQWGGLFFVEEDRARGEVEKELFIATKEGRAENERGHLRKNTTRFWGSGVMTPVYNSRGELDAFVKIMRDQTERKLLEEERQRLLTAEQKARVEAEAVNRMKDEFLANLSHELRTPLSAIVGWTRLLSSGGLSEKDQKHALEVIERSARAQTRLTEDLLDTSRIVSGKLHLDIQQVHLPSVIAAALETVAPAAEARKIDLRVQVDQVAEPFTGDPNRLQQIVWNLLSNAIKFSPEGGQVDVRLRRVDGRAQLTVSDNGPGIAPEFLPHVFDRFRQADASTTRAHGGMGLGLAIVRELVMLHGGSIAAESEPGQGAAFIVELPFRSAAGDRQGYEAALSTNAAGAAFNCGATLDGVQVLVVDDEPDIRGMVSTLLEICGAQVTAAESAEKGAELLTRAKPDIVLTDLAMPGQDGYAFLKRIQSIENEQNRRIPVAALTAYAGIEDEKKALEAGFEAYVRKPVDPAKLVSELARLTGKDS